MLSRWRKQARKGMFVTKKVDADREVAAELKQLRQVKKAYERLKIEHDLLKIAIAFTSTQRKMSTHSSPITKKPTA